MSVIGNVMQRVRVQVAQRRLRLEDFFTDFDKLRSGRITAAQFRRALAINRIEFSEEEFELLKDIFAVPASKHATGGESPRDSATDISYTAFLKAIRSEEAPAELLTTLGRKAKVLSDEEEHKLETVMRSMRYTMRIRGLNVRKAFEDFDVLHCGKVTASRFRRCIPFETVPEDALQLIIKKYSNEDGDFLYAMWCKELEGGSTKNSPRGATLSPESSAYTSQRGGATSLSIDGLLRALREQFAMYRLRCDDYLRDYDHFRTGFVTAPQFESALGRLEFVNFQLTAEHIATLTRAYTDVTWEGTGCGTNEEVFPRINYVQFLADTRPRNEETAPTAANYYESTRSPGQFLGVNSNDMEHQRTEALLNKVRQLIRSNRIDLVHTLHDFDRVQKGIYEHRTCTASRFSRALATNKIFLKAEEIALLVKHYAIRAANGTRTDEVNYYQFVMDVEDVNKPEVRKAHLLRSAAATAQQHAESTRPPPADTVSGVLAKVAAQAEERHLRVSEFFIDFDRLRSGIVQTEKFVIALGIAGLQLHPQELELLQVEYKSDKVQDHINVNRFIADVGEIAPTVVPSVATRFNMTTSRTMTGVGAAMIKESVKSLADKFTDAEREQLQRLLARLAHNVASHNALLTPFFSDFDRFHRGKILRTNFLQALSRHQFTLSPTETNLLSRYYASAEDSELIEYTRFIRDVGQERTLGSTQGTSPVTHGTCGNATTVAERDCLLPDGTLDEDLVERVLTKICCFLQERNARLSEFFPDGDELRHQHVTNSRFRHCLSILGLEFSEVELQALETAFAHTELQSHVNYPAFLSVVSDKLKAGVGLMAVEQRRRRSCTTTIAATAATAPASIAPSTTTTTTTTTTHKPFSSMDGTQACTNAIEKALAELYESAMDKVRRTLASRRSCSLEAFRQYDRARKGLVKEGQFFATLMSLGVKLSPAQSDAIRKAYTMGGGEIGYTKFSLAVDDPRFT